MFLKSLEIRGFKSFADKTEVSFNKGITTVVGPNGSGKSNISDAVRWVLGEQSIKTLRGGKMEDVIFAGTQYRRPVGLAQVAITLDNSDSELPIDYSDVTISRRLYRSGESEYYINNSKCRLKDIQELFMDTGIGKEGYSIIGQGKIDAILSGKPEDRRKLLEEAAGIVKFKTRKEEAERKLINTEQNLTRIEDILSTYEERLGPLEIERNKAKEFLKLSEELKIKEINLILYNIKSLEERILFIKKNIDKFNDEMNKYEKEKEELKSQFDELEEEMEKFNKDIEREKSDYYNKQWEHKDIISKMEILNERISNLKSVIDKNSIDIKNLEHKKESFYKEKNLKEKELEKFQMDQTSLNINIVKLENYILSLNKEISTDKQILDNLKKEQIDVAGKISELKNSNIIYKNEVEELKKKISHIKESCVGYANSIKINSNTKNILKEEREKLSICIVEHEDEIKSSRREISKLNIQLKEQEIKFKSNNKKLNTLEANRNILANLDKEYEGYTKTVKNLMHDLSKGLLEIQKQHCHVLGEIVDVPKELEVAIEIALGASISNIITKDETTAKKLISYLKENRLGRATFLPLDIVRGKKLDLYPEIKNIKGYLGIASELINYNNIFNPIIQYVLGRTIIAKDLDCAIHIAKASKFKFKIVTLDGEIVNAGGALTGGSLYGKNTGIISRKRHIEEIELEVEKSKEEISKVAYDIKNLNKIIKELDDKCLNLKDEIHYKNIEITKIDGKTSAIEMETEKLNKNLSVSTEEINVISKTLKYKESQTEEFYKNIDLYIEKEKENNEKIRNLEFKLKDRDKLIEDNKENLTELRIKKAGLDEIVNNKISELSRISKEGEAIDIKIETLKKEIEKSEETYQSSLKNIEENKMKIEHVLRSLEVLKNAYESKEVEKIKVKESIDKYKNKLEEMNLLIANKEKEIHKEQISHTKYVTEKENVYLKLNDEFQITYAEALEYAIENFNLKEFKLDIQNLKEGISKLGVVNLGAIEEFEDIRDKFKFMNNQKEDLISAREELMQVINDMTGKMKVMFNENFNKLRKYFNETFQELFKGGRADLLLGEGDELSCNIEINVEPPGKKLQNINLMSGGEKGLSAIALLFAILKMKPTPFCILDEIEAALDDANVVRYADFLRAFSNNVQFIVITHRKGTMEASDVMYGVTMQEKGISKVVSIQLNN
ncbi:chromosome segregation protein SMC [Haloimpatiens massiliensis]|uniref:chromosome segregation protein SMC n=1 Tax=Haloimpatiens massiliensis TaxID=1658110 RepID=UPI000C823B5C|nr:chromosome segregation protein SMC [Haloimpatiens massiliensis]